MPGYDGCFPTTTSKNCCYSSSSSYIWPTIPRCSGATDVDEHQTRQGEHFLTFISSGDIWADWTYFTGSAWIIQTNVTGGTLFAGGWERPRLFQDLTLKTHLLAYHTNQGGADPLVTGLYYMWTTDDCQTFGPIVSGLLAPVLILASATAGMIRGAIDGPLMMIVMIPDSGTSGPCTFQSAYRPTPEAAWSTLTTIVDDSASNLHSAGYQFGFDHASESEDRWTISFVPSGGSTPTVYACSDRGLTWKLI